MSGPRAQRGERRLRPGGPRKVKRTGTRSDGGVPSRSRVIAQLLGYLERFRVHFFATADRHGLTPMQAKALWLLERPRPMRGVAECLSCDPSNITGVVNRLQDRGLAVREEGAEDRRVKQLRLTREGLRLRVALLADLHKDAPGVGGLNDEQLAALGRALDTLDGR